MSVYLFADGNSCSVRNNLGANGSVVLQHNNAIAGDNGQVCTTVKFTGDRGSNASSNTIHVMVYCFDATGRCLIDSKSITVKMDGTIAYACFNVEKNKSYTFRVSDAYCQ